MPELIAGSGVLLEETFDELAVSATAAALPTQSSFLSTGYVQVVDGASEAKIPITTFAGLLSEVFGGDGGGGLPGASNVETQLGISTTRAVTPASLDATLPGVPLSHFGTLDMTGATDMTAVLQNAATSLAGTGRILDIPPGIIRVEGDLQLPPNVQWRGPGGNRYKDGAGGVSIRYYGEGTMITIDGRTIANGGFLATSLTDNIQGCIQGVRLSYVGSVGDATTSKAVAMFGCADFRFEDVYSLSFGTGYDIASSVSALRMEGCYTSGKIYGLKGVGASDCRFSDSQYSGGVYGLWMESCPSLQLRGVRPQVSGTCGIFLDRCSHLSWVGGIDDSATLKPSGSREGARLKDCRVAVIVGVPFYSNFSHLVIENTGEDFTGTYALAIAACAFEGNDSIRIEQNGGKAKRVSITGCATTSSIATLLEIEACTGGAEPIEELVVLGNTGAGLGIYGIQNADPDTLILNNANVPAYDNGIARVRGGMYATPFHVTLPDVSGSRYSQGSATAPMITGDLCVVVEVAADTWALGPGVRRTIASQYTSSGGNNRSWSFDHRVPTGAGPHSLSLVWSPDGTSGAAITKNMDGTIPAADGAFYYLAFTHDVDNGASGNDVRFWMSPDGVTWTQFGTTITTAGVTTHGGTAAELALGGIVGGTSQRFLGKVRHISARTGIGAAGIVGGTEVAEWTAAVPTFTYRDKFGGLWEPRGSAILSGAAPAMDLTIPDGDKGDITISSGVWSIDSAAVSLAKMANLAQDQTIGRVTASTGVPETYTVTAAARTLLDDVSIAAIRATLGLPMAEVNIRKTTDEIVNNSTTMQDDNELLFAIAANEVWVGRMAVFYIGDATADIQPEVTGPSGSSVQASGFGARVSDTVVQVSLLTASSSFGSAATSRVMLIEFSVANSTTPGSVKFRWAQNSPVVADTTVKAGSWLTAKRMA